MNVAFIITNLATGGAEMMLLKLLQNIDRRRFQPTVISLMGMGEIGPRIEVLGIPMHTLGMRPSLPNPLLFFRLIKLLRALRPDVVHTWMYHADLIGGMAARLAGVRAVAWGLRNSDLPVETTKRSTREVMKVCAIVSSWMPADIISCSTRAKQVHIAAGYAAEKMRVIPNGFDLSRFVPNAVARDGLRKELGLPADALLVGVIARFDPQKNHLGFVQAAAQVWAQVPQVHFVLAGKDVDGGNAELQAAIAAHPGLAAQMHLLGRRDDIPRLMAALDVLASPSHGEAFPNVLGEAMACGVPCVVTDAGDSAEIVSETGRVVAIGDMDGLARELVAMLQMPPAARAQLGRAARARVQENYEIGHVARLYEAAYVRVYAQERVGV